MENDVFPYIGNKPMTDITTANIMEMLKVVEARGALDMLKRVRSRCNAIYRFAIVNSNGLLQVNSVDPINLSENFAGRRISHYKHLNGDLCLSFNVMKERGWKSNSQLSKAKNNLIKSGFIEVTRQGMRHPLTLYALTYLPINECNGKLDVKPTK